MKLESYLFIKDHEKTAANRDVKRRTYLLGILLCLIACCFILLEIVWVALTFGLIGLSLLSAGEYILFRSTDKGSIPTKFIIDNDKITMMGQEFNINELKDLKFNLVNYEHGPTYNELKQPEGHENEIQFRLNEKLLRMNFFIPTVKHYVDLIDYLEERKIDYRARTGFPLT